MLRYIIVRLGQATLTLIGVSIFVFSIRPDYNPQTLRYICGCWDDDLEIVETRLGLKAPLYVQYLNFVKQAALGDFGISLRWQGQTAIELVTKLLPNTFQLVAVSVGMVVLLAVPLGAMSAIKRGTMLDAIGRGVARLGLSSPPFFLGIMLIWVFAAKLEWLPRSSWGEPLGWVLPAVALSWFSMASVIRITRGAMLDALDGNYVKMARIKGVPEWKVICKHSLVTAIPPILSAFPLLAALYMFNAVAIEVVFEWPGVGLLGWQAVQARDYYVLQAVIMSVSVLVIGAGLFIDVLRAALDPRVRDAEGEAYSFRAEGFA